MAQKQPKQKFRKPCVCGKPIMDTDAYALISGVPYHMKCYEKEQAEKNKQKD